MAAPTCNRCQAQILLARLHTPDGPWRPLNQTVVHPTDPGALLLTTRVYQRKHVRVAVPLADLVNDTATARGWTETRALAFVSDGYEAHTLHRCANPTEQERAA